MAEFTHEDLRKARESRNIKRWSIAGECGVSEDTVRRWEKGETEPSPDDVDNFERALNATGIWHRWMLSHYDSYRARYADVPEVGHIAADVCRMKHEITDLLPYFDDLERDAIDGTFGDVSLCKKYRKEAQEAMASIQRVLDKLPEDT